MGAALTSHLRELTAALVPLEQDVAEVREVVEPLQGVSERVGRLTDRLPGGGSVPETHRAAIVAAKGGVNAMASRLSGEGPARTYRLLGHGAVSVSALSGRRSVAKSDRRALARTPGVAVTEWKSTEAQMAKVAAAKIRSPSASSNRST